MSEQAIKVENLAKHFGEAESRVNVIENTSFTINKGELVALVAPSGAGKTTLLMMIGCVLEPTSGEIWLGEEKVYENRWIAKDTRKIRRENIGFIFQAHYLIPFLNVIENVVLLPETNGIKEADEPTAALDIERSVSVVKMLKKIATEQNVAIIMVTHDERMLQYCDRVMKIENHGIVFKDAAAGEKII